MGTKEPSHLSFIEKFLNTDVKEFDFDSVRSEVYFPRVYRRDLGPIS